MHHSFRCLREVICVSYTPKTDDKIFWGAAKFKTENETTPPTTTFSMFPAHIPSSNGLYCSASLMAHFHVQMSKQVICSCPLPCEIRDHVTLLYVKHVGILVFKFPVVYVYMSSGAVVSLVHSYS